MKNFITIGDTVVFTSQINFIRKDYDYRGIEKVFQIVIVFNGDSSKLNIAYATENERDAAFGTLLASLN